MCVIQRRALCSGSCTTSSSTLASSARRRRPAAAPGDACWSRRRPAACRRPTRTTPADLPAPPHTSSCSKSPESIVRALRDSAVDWQSVQSEIHPGCSKFLSLRRRTRTTRCVTPVELYAKWTVKVMYTDDGRRPK